MSTRQHQAYVPAAGRERLTALYDPVVALTMREKTFRGRLTGQVLAGAAAGQHLSVVDVGGGTGTLATQLAARGAAVTVVDGDPRILRRAKAKPGAEAITFICALAGELPLKTASADRVVMSLLLHHLAPDQKHAALAEARRVLRPGGRLHVADWGRPQGLITRAGFRGLQLLDGAENTREHGAGQLPARIAGAGFAAVTTLDRLRTPWGTLELICAHPQPTQKVAA